MREGDTINVYKYLLSMKILRSWKVHCDMKRDDGEKLKIKKKNPGNSQGNFWKLPREAYNLHPCRYTQNTSGHSPEKIHLMALPRAGD